MTLYHHRSQGGFTLIEVLAALSILALTIASLSQVRSLAHRHITVSQQLQLASYHADSHLNRLTSSTTLLEPGFQSGEYQSYDESLVFPWELELQELDPQTLAPHSNRFSNKVQPLKALLRVWLDSGQRKLEFETLLLRTPGPKVSPASFELLAPTDRGANK